MMVTRLVPVHRLQSAEAADIFIQYQDQHSLEIVLHSLARAWRETGDAQIPGKLAAWLEVPVEEAESRLAGFGDTGSEAGG